MSRKTKSYQCGDRLRLLRVNSKLKQAEMAQIMGISRGHYAHAESGKPVGIGPLMLTSQHFAVRLEWLMRGDEPMMADAECDSTKVSSLRSGYMARLSPKDIRMVNEDHAPYGASGTVIESVREIASQLSMDPDALWDAIVHRMAEDLRVKKEQGDE